MKYFSILISFSVLWFYQTTMYSKIITFYQPKLNKYKKMYCENEKYNYEFINENFLYNILCQISKTKF